MLLTDCRANITLDGQASRVPAGTEAIDVAKGFRQLNIDSLVIATGKRPSSSLQTLAKALDAPYVTMPRTDAISLSKSVLGVLEA